MFDAVSMPLGTRSCGRTGSGGSLRCPAVALEATSVVPRVLADDYIFHTVKGRSLSKSSLWYAWRPVQRAWGAAGRRDMDLYELRHAAATVLLERGVAHAD